MDVTKSTLRHGEIYCCCNNPQYTLQWKEQQFAFKCILVQDNNSDVILLDDQPLYVETSPTQWTAVSMNTGKLPTKAERMYFKDPVNFPYGMHWKDLPDDVRVGWFGPINKL